MRARHAATAVPMSFRVFARRAIAASASIGVGAAAYPLVSAPFPLALSESPASPREKLVVLGSGWPAGAVGVTPTNVPACLLLASPHGVKEKSRAVKSLGCLPKLLLYQKLISNHMNLGGISSCLWSVGLLCC